MVAGEGSEDTVPGEGLGLRAERVLVPGRVTEALNKVRLTESKFAGQATRRYFRCQDVSAVDEVVVGIILHLLHGLLDIRVRRVLLLPRHPSPPGADHGRRVSRGVPRGPQASVLQ